MDLIYHKNFEELLKSCAITEFGCNNQKLLLCKLDEFYTKEEVKQHGVIGIKIEKTNQY